MRIDRFELIYRERSFRGGEHCLTILYLEGEIGGWKLQNMKKEHKSVIDSSVRALVVDRWD